MPITNMKAIQTVTVGAGGASSIDFTSIPQTYTDLVVVLSLRADSGTSYNDTRMTINSSTSGYTSRLLYGTGSGTGSANNNTYQYAYWVGSATTPSYTASTFSNIEVYIPNYSSSNNKSASVTGVAENNGTLGTQLMTALLWANSNAITSLSFTQDYGNYVQYSTATLYGVSNTIASGAKAYGGYVTEDSNYFYHTFLSSGIFTPIQSISADILVVAGGGAGGADASGGGGAGGLLGFNSQSLTATNYVVTIGAGGARTTSGNGNTGSDSQFGSLTLVTGGGGGGTYGNNGQNGGSGGGAGGISGGGTLSGGTATPSGQGNNGGGRSGGTAYGQGGGGGASAAGGASTGGNGGNGGNGSSAYSSWGLATNTGELVSGSYYYAGGGGGGTQPGQTVGTGGYGGGSAGVATLTPSNALANTGGGGGGTAFSGAQNSGAGGSGIVIVRYAK